jgi:hypothetical protein
VPRQALKARVRHRRSSIEARNPISTHISAYLPSPVTSINSSTLCRSLYSFIRDQLPLQRRTQWRTGRFWPRAHPTQLIESSYAPFIGLLVVVVFCAAAWILSPKGENQTYVPDFQHIRLRLHTTSGAQSGTQINPPAFTAACHTL